MKKKLFDRRGAGIELAILMMVVSFSMSILLTSVALIQSTKKVRAEERLQQSIALEQLGQDFLSAVLKGDVDGWIQSINNKNNHTGHTEQATAHQWGEWSEDTATCTETGTQTRGCTVCGAQDEAKTTAALGHSYDGGVITTSNCTEEVIKFACTRDNCTYSYTETIPVEHQCNGEEKYENGVKVFTCAICNETFEDGSSFVHSGVQTGTEEATCTAEGKKIFRCNCGEIYTENIPILEHSYEEEVTKEPTCNDAGEKTFTCVCGDSYTEEIPASHTWDAEGKCTFEGCEATKSFEPQHYDAYNLVVYKDGENIRIDVTITKDSTVLCPGKIVQAVEEDDDDTETAVPAGKQVLVIRVERDTEAEEITYKITEWTKNDRS